MRCFNTPTLAREPLARPNIGRTVMRVCRGGSFVALAYSLITPWSWAEENPKEAITRLGGRVDEFVEDGHVVYVEVKFSRFLGPFTSLKPLARLPRIDALYVEDAGIGDPALRTIGQRTELTVLDVSRSFVTDEGLAQLQHLASVCPKKHFGLAFSAKDAKILLEE